MTTVVSGIDEVKEDVIELNVNKKKALWLSHEIHLNDVNVLDQTFSIRCWLNGFWIDEELANILKSNDKCISGSAVMTDYNKYLPFTTNCFHNGSDVIEINNTKLRLFNEECNLIQIAYDVTTIIHQKFDVIEFPFDPQFLDIQFSFRKKMFYVLSKAPIEWKLFGDYHFDRIIQVKMQDSLTEYRLLSPWIDFREKPIAFLDKKETFDFNFSLIRLRVQRIPGYYLEYVVFPLWVIVTIAICLLALSAKNVEGRLGFLVTLLLTVVAFQYSTSESLPNTAQITVIDKYITFAYCIVGILLAHSAFVGAILLDKDNENENIPQWINSYDVGITCGSILLWSFFSIYLVLYRYCTYTNVDWEELSDKLMREWTINETQSTDKNKTSRRFLLASTDRIFGSYTQ